MTYEIMFDQDYVLYEDEYGDAVYDTVTCSVYFTGSHIELLDYLEQLRKSNDVYNITAEAMYEE